MRERAVEREGLDPVVHLRLLDRDQDIFEETLRNAAAEFRVGCEDLAKEMRATFKQISDRQTRNFTLFVAAVLAFAGSIVTAVLVT